MSFWVRLLSTRPPVIAITSAAAKRLKTAAAGFKYVRLETKRKGCSGIEYNLEPTNEAKPSEETHHVEGIPILVDQNSLLYVIGSKIDTEESDIATQFVVKNELAKGVCGCGKSFIL